MNAKKHEPYQLIEKIILYLQVKGKQQISVAEIARHFSMESKELNLLVLDWCGSTLKQFLQYINTNYTKEKLSEKKNTLFEVYKNEDINSRQNIQINTCTFEEVASTELIIQYQFYDSRFGKMIIASTTKGICAIEFYENEQSIFEKIISLFPHAILKNEEATFHQIALSFIQDPLKHKSIIHLHLQATDFQLTVWNALLKIPISELTTYGKMAIELNNPNAARAIGTAIGSNPIAYIIPCHRVIQSTGNTGGYMWNPIRKIAMIAWEAAYLNTN